MSMSSVVFHITFQADPNDPERARAYVNGEHYAGAIRKRTQYATDPITNIRTPYDEIIFRAPNKSSGRKPRNVTALQTYSYTTGAYTFKSVSQCVEDGTINVFAPIVLHSFMN